MFASFVSTQSNTVNGLIGDLSRMVVREKISSTYVLTNFSNLYQRIYESSVFCPPSNETIRFFVSCSPRGTSSVWDDTHTIIHLSADPGNQPILPVKCRFALIDCNGERRFVQECYSIFIPGKKDYQRILHSCQYLISKTYLIDNCNELLPNDKLTIVCDVDWLDYDNAIPADYDQLKQQRASDNFQSLLDNGKFADVILLVSGKEFRAHRNILSCRSTTFAAMFESGPKDKPADGECSRWVITDVDNPDVFYEMLRYIYSLKTQALAQFDSQLLAAADKYNLDCLKFICEQSLRLKMSIETAANWLLLADTYNAQSLKAKCIEYITDHANEVMATDGWRATTTARPELAVQLYQDFVQKNTTGRLISNVNNKRK